MRGRPKSYNALAKACHLHDVSRIKELFRAIRIFYSDLQLFAINTGSAVYVIPFYEINVLCNMVKLKKEDTYSPIIHCTTFSDMFNIKEGEIFSNKLYS